MREGAVCQPVCDVADKPPGADNGNIFRLDGVGIGSLAGPYVGHRLYRCGEIDIDIFAGVCLTSAPMGQTA
jgi:hypothetical protein